MKNQHDLSDLYSSIINEINRYRDWPIRILTFTSALHFAIIGAFIFKGGILNLTEGIKSILTFFLIILGIWTIIIFHHCHIQYLTTRNTQARIQKYWGLNDLIVDGETVFPQKWFNVVTESGCEKFHGWGFYSFYSLALSICSIWSIWNF